MTRQEKSTIIAKEAICRAAKAAWGVDQQALEGQAQGHPLAFQRALCILAMHDELGIGRVRACKAFGRSPGCFVACRRSASRWLDDSALCRELAGDFVRELDAVFAAA